MPFGLGMFRSLLTRNNLQAPQAQIGAMAPQSPMRARRAVQQEAGGGAIGGMGTPTAGSQPQDGVQIAANRPRTFNAPGSMAEQMGQPAMETPSLQNAPSMSRLPQYPVMDQDPEELQRKREIALAEQDVALKRDNVNNVIDEYNRVMPKPVMPILPTFRDFASMPNGSQSFVDETPIASETRPRRSMPGAQMPLASSPILDAVEANAAKREQQRADLLARQPKPIDAAGIADQEVRQKGKLWRLGQVGLGALKGFVGANPNGGSGILGAISGAVGGGTGDLYRQNRTATLQNKYLQERQGFQDELGAFNTLDDNARQQDAVLNAAARNDMNYQTKLADLELKVKKGELDQAKFEVYRQKIEEDHAIARERINKDYAAIEAAGKRLTETQAAMDRRSRETLSVRQSEGDKNRALRASEGEKSRSAAASRASMTSGTGKGKRMTDSDVRNEATKRINRLVDQELSKQGIKPDDPDDKVVAPNPVDPKSPITAGTIRKRLNRKYFDKQGYYQGALQGSVAANIRRQEAGEDVEDFAGTPFETKKSLSRPGVK